MAGYSGPVIATKNLTMNFDAGDKTSYPGSGTSCTDLSKEKNVVAITNATFSTDGQGSISFDGSGDYITVDGHSSINFGSGEFTYEVWYKTDAGSERGLICKYGYNF